MRATLPSLMKAIGKGSLMACEPALQEQQAMIGPLRRRLRFGLGGLMLAILVICLWLGYRVNKARDHLRANAAVKAAGGWVRYSDEFVMGPVNVPYGNALWKPNWGTLTPGKGSVLPTCLRGWIGDEYFREIVHVSNFVDIQKGKGKTPGLNRPPLDDMLRSLESQKRLRTLLIGGAAVTDDGLASIARLGDQRELFIMWGSGMIDAGIARIAQLPGCGRSVSDYRN